MKKNDVFAKFHSLFITFLLFTLSATAQVGIGTTTPASGALLDLTSTDRGLLVPRVSINNLGTAAPVTAPTTGLLVWNTFTGAGIGVGYHYWNGTRWIPIGNGGVDWALTGNAITTANFLGTTNDMSLNIRTNNINRMRVQNNGLITINRGAANAFAGDQFSTWTTSGSAVNGYATNGFGIYGQASSGIATVGSATTGVGVFGEATSGDGVNAVSTSGLGLFASSTNADGIQSLSTNNTGAVGGSFTLTGTGVAGTSDLTDGAYSILVNGSGVAGEGLTTGVYGVSNSTTSTAFGGYFVNDGSYAYVGGWENFLGWTDYKILGSGIVSTIVKGTDNQLLTMACPESPEVLFQDYGIGQLVNGSARINIDPNFTKNIRVDTEHPMKVFVQLEGDCNGVFVTNKSANGFDVKELQGGNSNVSFSWSITATRADEDRQLSSGDIKTSEFGWRFKPAPGPMEVKKTKIKNNNNNSLRKNIEPNLSEQE